MNTRFLKIRRNWIQKSAKNAQPCWKYKRINVSFKSGSMCHYTYYFMFISKRHLRLICPLSILSHQSNYSFPTRAPRMVCKPLWIYWQYSSPRNSKNKFCYPFVRYESIGCKKHHLISKNIENEFCLSLTIIVNLLNKVRRI